MTAHQGSSEKIIILGENNEAFLLGDRPDAFVVVAGEAKLTDVKAIWKQRQKDFNQPKRQILVE